MAAGIEFEFRFSRQRIGAGSASGALRILVLADLSGARSSPMPGLAARRPRRMDLDRFDDGMARITPSVVLPAGLAAAEELRLGFSDMEGFTADALAPRLPLIAALTELRRQLDNPGSFEAAAASIRAMSHAPADSPAAEAPATPADTAGDEADGDTMQRLLGGATSAHTASAPRTAGIADRLIAEAVAAHIVADADPRQAVYRQWVEQAMAERLRAVLRFAPLRALERAWRSLSLLVETLDPDEELEIAVLDATPGELLADLAGCGGDIAASGLYEAVQGHAGGAADMQSWSALIADIDFGGSAEEMELLAGLAALAGHVGAPLLAGAAPSLLGAASFWQAGDAREWQATADVAARWQAMRRAESAEWVALAAPRVMLRLPYGKGGERCELCPIEETAGGDDHEGYLWGCGAFALARLLGLAFRERGWDMEPGDVLDIEDLPAHVYTDADGDAQLKPCAEGLLNERNLTAMLGMGVSPIGSYRDRNAARLMRIQSIAEPPAALAGRWRRSD